ncbi:MAG: hypothetical protein HDT26_11010 [Subdoligranulum sp.]|nr:hypothetical protein [Subdoligranulum sp.]
MAVKKNTFLLYRKPRGKARCRFADFFTFFAEGLSKTVENESFGAVCASNAQKIPKRGKARRPARACPGARGGDWGRSLPKNAGKCQNFSKQNKFRLCKMKENMLY